jgi:hypothetical protein
MPREVGPYAGGSCRRKNHLDVLDDRFAIRNLLQDSNLHVIDEQTKTLRAANLVKRPRDGETVEPIHSNHPNALKRPDPAGLRSDSPRRLQKRWVQITPITSV